MRKPKLIISKCLNSEKCRFDGQGYDDKVISLLRDYVDIETVCPETSIGLSIPRNPLRIEKDSDVNRLIEAKSNVDYTYQMCEFAEEFINGMDDIDGFILKSRSPSCGIKDVKVYPKSQKCSISKNATGIFSSKVIEKISNIPIENEGRLKNYNIRDEFLTKIFTINDFKCTDSILDFHNKNILLLKSYSIKISKELDSIANKQNLNETDIDLYKSKLYELLNKKRNKKNKVKICKGIFENFKDKLIKNEIDYFYNLLNLYENEKTPFSSIIVALQMYSIRFNNEELLNQTFFNPYPKCLVNISDSGKGRNL
ncbi:YbgA family protein [Clostridium butyricum]|uniref:YbgA family protein n=1 Tax=Clostridium butyricum TaxID=1492 RepID=UPI003D34B68B